MKYFHGSMLALTIFALFLTVAPAQGQVQKAKGLNTTDAVLTASPKESSVKSGNAIWVDVTVENKSDHQLLIYRALTAVDDDQGGWVYHADVQGDKGEKPQPTKFRTNIGSGGYIHVQPGNTLTDRINICKLFDLNRPGKYSIQVYRRDTTDRTTLRSNTITVTVAP